MTLQDAKRIVNDLGLTLQRTDWDEYRLAPRNARESQAYYTPDLDDAVGTAWNWR